jgi:predicted lipoprotein with Yx(FWY)xxD motif
MESRVRLYRSGSLVVLLALLGLSQIAARAADAAQAGHRSAARTVVEVQDTLAGPLVTDAGGYVLFVFPKEHGSDAFCRRIPKCMRDWPPVTTLRSAIAGPGLDAALLRTIPYEGRLRQVTYAGHPLHLYRFAYSAQGSAINIGIKQFGGPWEGLTATGGLVK